MAEVPDALPAGLVSAVSRAGLPAIVWLPSAGSTNDEALSRAQAGVPEFTAVLAEAQTAGRGRRGRSWVSPPGAGMYLSVIVRDRGLGADVPLVTLAAGVAVAEAVGHVSSLPIELKWPNDLVIGRPWRKLGGILCEASAIGTPEGVLVIGVGVNLLRAAYPPEIADRATSLEAECDRPVSLTDLAVATLCRIREHVTYLRDGRRGVVLDRWRHFGRTALDNQPVAWQDSQGVHRGAACGVSEAGALMVRTMDPASGALHTEHVIAGDVQWERLSRV